MRRSTLAEAAVLVALAAGALAQAPAPSSLETLLSAARAYVQEYERQLSLLVSEESYVQQILSLPTPRGSSSFPADPRGQKRVLRSDYLLVKLADGGGWMPFRDVFEVDGKLLHDRSSRLERLFLKPSASTIDQATALMQESARYNIGPVTRNINIPLLGMLMVSEEVVHRFTFDLEKAESVAGIPAWRLRYREQEHPTLIRGLSGADVPLSGQLWIAAAGGTVLRTHLEAANQSVRSTITVDFRYDAPLELWVPAEMREVYRARGARGEVIGLATYSNVRKFQVNTEELVRKPPGF